MRYCSKHHANPDDAVFCNECGERLTRVTNANHICPKCGASNPTDAKFCHNCGMSFTCSPTQKSTPILGVERGQKLTTTFTHSSGNSNTIFSIISKINKSFVYNYRYTEDYLLGKIGMLACTILTVFSLYGFINCCINGNGLGFLHLTIIISYIGICYQKSLGAIAWTISCIILIINQICFLADIISQDLLGSLMEEFPISCTKIALGWICFIISAHCMLKERDNPFWE